MIRLPKYVWIIAFLFCWPTLVLAEPMAQFQADKARIVLHTEPCTLKAEIANLPGRATWEEIGKTFEGCFGVIDGIVAFYFSDKTVVTVPVRYLQRVTPI